MIAAARERPGAPLARWAGIVCERLAALARRHVPRATPSPPRSTARSRWPGWRPARPGRPARRRGRMADDGASTRGSIARVGAACGGGSTRRGRAALDRAADLAAATPGSGAATSRCSAGFPAERGGAPGAARSALTSRRRIPRGAATPSAPTPPARRARAAPPTRPWRRCAGSSASSRRRRRPRPARLGSILGRRADAARPHRRCEELPDLVRVAAGGAPRWRTPTRRADETRSALATTALDRVTADAREAVASALCQGLARSDVACAGLGVWLPALLDAASAAAPSDGDPRADPFTIGRFEAAMALTPTAAEATRSSIARVIAAVDARRAPGTELERHLVAEDHTDPRARRSSGATATTRRGARRRPRGPLRADFQQPRATCWAASRRSSSRCCSRRAARRARPDGRRLPRAGRPPARGRPPQWAA